MPGITNLQPVASLTAVRAGDCVRIHEILMDSVRVQCAAHDLRVGDVVHCRLAGRAALLLTTPMGQTFSLERDRARFIRVSTLGTC
jgi:hypothetical protein